MRKLLPCLALTVVAALAVPPAHAGGFVGGSLGSTDVDWNAPFTNLDFGDDDSSWKIFGGWGIKYFGLEVSYIDFGQFVDENSGTVARTDLQGLDAFFYGRFPFAKFFEVFAKAGLVYWDEDSTFQSSNAFARRDTTGNDFAYGAGVGFNFGKHFGLRVEYEVFEIENTDDVTLTSAGVLFRF